LSSVLTELMTNRASGRYEADRNDIGSCHAILLKLAEYLCSTIDSFPEHVVDLKMAMKELVSRLELDGFSLVGGQLIPTGSEVVNQPEEVSFLLKKVLSHILLG
jgi:hypothetical protein